MGPWMELECEFEAPSNNRNVEKIEMIIRLPQELLKTNSLVSSLLY